MTTIQTLTEQFRTAHANIGLGARRKIAIAAHLEVRAALKLARPLVDRGLVDVLIGSYPRRTGIWPGKDVDVFGKLTSESIDTIEPSAAYDLFYTVLDRAFPGRVQPQDRSVKIDYRPSTLPGMPFIREAARLLEQPDTVGPSDGFEFSVDVERCDTAMIWLGGNTLNSEFVSKIEIPLIFHHHSNRGLRIVPLFVDLSVGDGVHAVRAATGHEIGSHNGYHFESVISLDEHLAAVAAREVRATLRQCAVGGGRPTVRCVTRSDAAGGRDEADLNFDWITEYPADGALPDAPTVDLLRSALHASSQHLISSFGAGSVDLHLKCHLHIACAVGFELRRVTGMRPRIDVEGAWWQVDVTPAVDAAERLAERVTNGPAGGTRTAIEISLTRDVGPMVKDYIAGTGTAYRRRIELAPAAGPDQQSVTPDNVNGWAEQAASTIRALRALPGVETTDIFLAAPVAFAVALGWRLNAIGGLHLFHPNANSGPYVRVWSLPAS